MLCRVANRGINISLGFSLEQLGKEACFVGGIKTGFTHPSLFYFMSFLFFYFFTAIAFFSHLRCHFYFFQFLNYFIVVQLQLLAFSPHLSTPPQPNPPSSPASTHPLGFVHVSFIVVPLNPSPHCPLPTPLWLLLDCS